MLRVFQVKVLAVSIVLPLEARDTMQKRRCSVSFLGVSSQVTAEGRDDWHGVRPGAALKYRRVGHRSKKVGIFPKVPKIPTVTENACRPVEGARGQSVGIPRQSRL